MYTATHNNHLLDRELASRIAVALGDSIGNREALILADPEVTVRRSGDYPGCWVVRSRMHNNSFVFRQSDNAIIN